MLMNTGSDFTIYATLEKSRESSVCLVYGLVWTRRVTRTNSLTLLGPPAESKVRTRNPGRSGSQSMWVVARPNSDKVLSIQNIEVRLKQHTSHILDSLQLPADKAL